MILQYTCMTCTDKIMAISISISLSFLHVWSLWLLSASSSQIELGTVKQRHLAVRYMLEYSSWLSVLVLVLQP
jgi:hypothetical protein